MVAIYIIMGGVLYLGVVASSAWLVERIDPGYLQVVTASHFGRFMFSLGCVPLLIYYLFEWWYWNGRTVFYWAVGVSACLVGIALLFLLLVWIALGDVWHYILTGQKRTGVDYWRCIEKHED